MATETFEGTVDGRRGTLALQQLGAMDEGEPTLHYVIAPGSGTDELAGLTGSLTVGTVHDDGQPRDEVQLELHLSLSDPEPQNTRVAP